MKSIPLTRGVSTIVDDSDHEFLSRWAWYAMPNGSGKFYAVRSARLSDGRLRGEPQKLIFMHRILAATPEGLVTDHINGDSLDNRRDNLRAVTHTHNMWNRAARADRRSRFKGVTFDKRRGKWAAVIQVNNSPIFLGRFQSEEAAGAAYARRAALEFGQYNRNPPHV